MKASRFFLSVALLAGLTFIQIPQSAQCAMSMGMPRAICSMPCCKMPLGHAKCPMMKASPIHEAITVFSTIFQPYVTAIATLLPQASNHRASQIKTLWTTLTSLLSIMPPEGRAPPADVVLFAA